MEGYWVKGYPYENPDRTTRKEEPVIHRFDTLAEANFFKGQVADSEILPWGSMSKRRNRNGD